MSVSSYHKRKLTWVDTDASARRAFGVAHAVLVLQRTRRHARVLIHLVHDVARRLFERVEEPPADSVVPWKVPGVTRKMESVPRAEEVLAWMMSVI